MSDILPFNNKSITDPIAALVDLYCDMLSDVSEYTVKSRRDLRPIVADELRQDKAKFLRYAAHVYTSKVNGIARITMHKGSAIDIFHMAEEGRISPTSKIRDRGDFRVPETAAAKFYRMASKGVSEAAISNGTSPNYKTLLSATEFGFLPPRAQNDIREA